VVEGHEIQVSREGDDPARIVANGLETHNNRTVLNVREGNYTTRVHQIIIQ
jgi:hypothetical protein